MIFLVKYDLNFVWFTNMLLEYFFLILRGIFFYVSLLNYVFLFIFLTLLSYACFVIIVLLNKTLVPIKKTLLKTIEFIACVLRSNIYFHIYLLTF